MTETAKTPTALAAADRAPRPLAEVKASSIEALSRYLNEPEALLQFRKRAWDRFVATPSPHRAQHLWRYTDPEEFEPRVDPFEIGSGGTAGLEPPVGVSPVQVMTFEEAARRAPDMLFQVAGALVGPEFGRFEALNAATFRKGVLVRVPRNAEIERPILLRTLLGQGSFEATRVAVVLEDGASATVIDELAGGFAEGTAASGGGARNARSAQQLYHVAEVVVGDGARLNYVAVERLGRRTALHLTHRARVGRNAAYRPVLASFGGALAKLDLGASLEGTGAESEMAGFLCGIERQRFDHHTTHHHLAAHTRSNLDFRTVLKDRARSAYTGLIRIETAAPFSEAYQENRNLLLSEQCRADSIPELEIMTQEVQCKHGATVGPLDAGQLFYLRSRGLAEADAIRLIVEGHFEGILKRLPEATREPLHALLVDRLRTL